MMGRRKINEILNILIMCSFCVLMLHGISFGQVIFEESFDNQANFSEAQSSGTYKLCWSGNACSPIPTNWSMWSQGASKLASKPGNNTLNINSNNARGGSGKALTFQTEGTGGVAGWQCDGLLGKELDFNGYDELYVRFFIKIDPSWQWNTSESPQEKMFRISHWEGGKPTAFGPQPDDQHGPMLLVLFAKWDSGTDPISIQLSYRYEVEYYPTGANPSHKKVTSFQFPKSGGGNCNWNESGCPGDGNWHAWEFYVKLNSSCGVADGEARFWYDGTEIATTTDLAWGDTGCQASPRKKWNYFFLGGNEFNRFSNYTNNDEQWYTIDDVVVSTTYIGPDYVIDGSTPPDTIPPANPSNAGQK